MLDVDERTIRHTHTHARRRVGQTLKFFRCRKGHKLLIAIARARIDRHLATDPRGRCTPLIISTTPDYACYSATFAHSHSEKFEKRWRDRQRYRHGGHEYRPLNEATYVATNEIVASASRRYSHGVTMPFRRADSREYFLDTRARPSDANLDAGRHFDGTRRTPIYAHCTRTRVFIDNTQRSPRTHALRRCQRHTPPVRETHLPKETRENGLAREDATATLRATRDKREAREVRHEISQLFAIGCASRFAQPSFAGMHGWTWRSARRKKAKNERQPR